MTVTAKISAVLFFCLTLIMDVTATAQDSGNGGGGRERGGILTHNRAEQDLKTKKKKKKAAEAKARAAKAKLQQQQQEPVKKDANGQPVYDANQMPVVVPEATPPPGKKKLWTADFYYEDYWTMSDADHHTGLQYTDGYIGGTYRVGPNTRLYLRQNALLNVDMHPAGDPGEQYHEYVGRLSDTEFGVYSDNIFTWEGGGSFNGYTRFYLSTGYHQWAVDAPEDSGQIFRFRPEFITSQPLGTHFEVGHIIDPRVMGNQRKGQTVLDGTALAQNVTGKTINQANATFKIEQFFYFTTRYAPFSSTVILGTYDFWYNNYTGPDGTSPATHHSYQYIDLSFTYQILKQVSMTIGVENDLQTDSTHPYEYSWLRERETYYYANTFMRF